MSVTMKLSSVQFVCEENGSVKVVWDARKTFKVYALGKFYTNHKEECSDLESARAIAAVLAHQYIEGELEPTGPARLR